MFYVWIINENYKLGMEISRLSVVKTKLEHENKKLLIQKTSLESPSRICKYAKKMGFVYPEEGEVIMVHD